MVCGYYSGSNNSCCSDILIFKTVKKTIDNLKLQNYNYFDFELFEVEIIFVLRRFMENKRLYGLLFCLHRQMSRDNHKLFAEYGISPVQMQVMIFIKRQTKEGKNVCQKDIEKCVNLRASAMSTMLTNLEKSGFITRTVADGDARTKYVRLTEKGDDVCLKDKLLIEKCDGIVQSALTEEEQETFKNLLLKIMAETEKEVKND